MADERKQELIRELADVRNRITANRAGLDDTLRVGDKIRENLSRFRGVWLGGAMLLGLVIAKLPARTKKVPVPISPSSKAEKSVKKVGLAGLGLTVLKMIFDLGRPFLLRWLTQRVRGGRY